MESMGTRLLNRPVPPANKPVPLVSSPLRVQKRFPKSFVMFNRGGLVEPICSQPSSRTLRSRPPADCAKYAAEKMELPKKSRVAHLADDLWKGMRAAIKQASKSVKDLGLAISTAILAIRNTLKSKGLYFSKGKFDDRWMQKWMWWYSYVRAMCRKIWEGSGIAARMSAKPLSVDARAPFQT